MNGADDRGDPGRPVPLEAFCPYGRTAPSSRTRIFEWFERIAPSAPIWSYTNRNDWRFGAADLPGVMRSEVRLRRARQSPRARTLVLHREAGPFSRGGLEESLLGAADRGVFDFDDAIYVRPDRWSPRRNLFRADVKTTRTIAAADVIIAGNEYLADWASSHASEIHVVPSCVEPSRYVHKHRFDVDERPQLVWVGSLSTIPLLRSIEPALQILHRTDGIRLTVIGDPRSHLGGLRAFTDLIPWSEAVVHRDLASFDLGLMPLIETESNRGKCGYKLLQYAAAGVPAMGSPVGANLEILDAFGAPAPRTIPEWIDAIRAELRSSEESRRERSAAQFRAVTSGYSFEVWEPTMKELLGLS